MKIDEMTDQEKSELLARLCGWEPEPDIGGDGITIHGIAWWNDEGGGSLDPEPKLPLNLYDPANMALAWRVLNWAHENLGVLEKGDIRDYFSATWNGPKPAALHWFYGKEAGEAQRLWLDKILKLAIAAGLVDENKDR